MFPQHKYYSIFLVKLQEVINHDPANRKKYYTPEEYLTLEEKATDKHEYRDGEIVVMPGGTTNHNQIAGNFYKRFPLNITKTRLLCLYE